LQNGKDDGEGGTAYDKGAFDRAPHREVRTRPALSLRLAPMQNLHPARFDFERCRNNKSFR
jgi:hypothetical protein